MGFALCLAVPVLAGPFLVGALRPRPAGLVLDACLGAGWGLGVSSVAWFLWLLLVGSPATGYVVAEIATFAGLAGLGFLLARRRFRTDVAPPPPPTALSHRILRRVLAVALAVVVVSSPVVLAVYWRAEPHGHWDAFSIWNLRARFLYRGGTYWQDGTSGVLDWSHPDYPLLVPAGVARCWTYLGGESTLAPALIGLLFTFATAGVLGAAVAALRGATHGLLAALVLLATPQFLTVGLGQIADVPLAYFIVSTVALLGLHDRAGGAANGGLFLAGMMAGFAAWTKNEGLLFLACVLPAWVALRGMRQGRKEALRGLLSLLLGLLPLALLLVYFKLRLAPPNDLVAGQAPQSTLSRLTDGRRYATIAAAFGRDLLAIGPWAVMVLAVAFVLLGGAPAAARRAAVLPLVVLALMLAGYFVAYLTTPRDLEWHLQTALHRLYVQVWPLALLGYFLLVATPEEAA